MARSLVHQDKYGIFVRTGGYIFRPQLSYWSKHQGYQQSAGTSSVSVGQNVHARHVGGTTVAMVNNEQWYSHGEGFQWDARKSTNRQRNSTTAWEPASAGLPERERRAPSVTVVNGKELALGDGKLWPQSYAAHPYTITEEP